MVDIDPKISDQGAAAGLLKLMLLRLSFVSILLGASVFIQVRESRAYFGEMQTVHYLLIATVYFLTFIYILLFKLLKNHIRQAYIQLLTDTVFITAIIYSTGGIESIFSFLYILTIINASILLYRRGGMIIASSSSILYGLLLDLHYYGLIHPFKGSWGYLTEYSDSQIFYITAVNIAAFYLVAFISSYPSEQARKSRVELKEKEEDINKLEALNDWIVKSITSGLITLDEQERIILFNPAAEEIFDIRAQDVIGKRIGEVLPFLEKHVLEKREILKQRVIHSAGYMDISYQKSEKEKRFLRFFMSPLQIPSEERKGSILFFRDITEMKKIEEEMKRVEGLALVGELAAGIAHEIRNPLASISGSFQMLKEGIEADHVSRRLMDIIMREIGRLDNLVSDFLSFARPKPADFREIALKTLIQESIELLCNSGKWKDSIIIRTEFDDSIRLCSDPEQIKQVLWNIFLNAVEAIDEKGFISIRTFTSIQNNSKGLKEKMAGISVRDSGRGFEQNALSHMFTPFFTTKEEGSGLGLAIVKRIVEGLQGRVTGCNHPEGGAEVTVYLKGD